MQRARMCKREGMPTGKEAAQQLAIARMGFGIAGFLMPRALGRAWVGPDGSSKSVNVIIRAFAVRDLALGLGAYLAATRDAPVRGWIEAGLLCDSGDILATLAGPMGRARKLGLALTALSGVASGVAALSGLEQESTTT
jgi:hypothetical protein